MNNSALTILIIGALGYYWWSQKRTSPASNFPNYDYGGGLPALPQPYSANGMPQLPKPWEIQPIGNVGPDWNTGFAQSGLLNFGQNNEGGSPLVLENSGFVSDAPAWLRDMAGQIVGQYFPSLDLEMVLAICKIESSFGKNIYRAEPLKNDASVGMMQTLIKTAQWLYGLGYKAFGYPTVETLKDHATSIYFGCAMLKWLSKKGGSEEEIVRAYNGGWGGRNKPWTIDYWKKYLKARGRYA